MCEEGEPERELGTAYEMYFSKPAACEDAIEAALFCVLFGESYSLTDFVVLYLHCFVLGVALGASSGEHLESFGIAVPVQQVPRCLW